MRTRSVCILSGSALQIFGHEIYGRSAWTQVSDIALFCRPKLPNSIPTQGLYCIFVLLSAGLNSMLTGFEDKSGYALCTFAFADKESDEDVLLFRGQTPVRLSSNVDFALPGDTFPWLSHI